MKVLFYPLQFLQFHFFSFLFPHLFFLIALFTISSKMLNGRGKKNRCPSPSPYFKGRASNRSPLNIMFFVMNILTDTFCKVKKVLGIYITNWVGILHVLFLHLFNLSFCFFFTQLILSLNYINRQTLNSSFIHWVNVSVVIFDVLIFYYVCIYDYK